MDTVDEIKDRLGVDEVIAGYIQLKPAGRNQKGLCPFHHEKTPSFMVNPEKGIWHCFGCGEGGDIFTFVQKMEGIDFKEALIKLAQKAGVNLPDTKTSASQQKNKERIYQVLESATRYYELMLRKTAEAKDYLLDKRRLTPKILTDFRVGYAPDGSHTISEYLLKKGFSEQDIIKAGLAKKISSKLTDFFRNRIVIPFLDTGGRPIGFTARTLIEDQTGPKYINSPQSIVYDKSRYIFGLYQARDAIRRAEESVVVEGNLDVLTAHQAGTGNVVAVSGTAFTIFQLKQLSRLASKVTLAFDADKAGLNATKRTIPLAQQAGISLRIITLPPGKDPDELIKQSISEWRLAIKSASYVVDWYLKVLQDQFDVTSAEGKKRISAEMLSVLKNLRDSVEQDHYVRKLAATLKVSYKAIRQQLDQPVSKPINKAAVYQASTAKKDGLGVVQDALLALAVAFADTRVSLQDIAEDYFTTDAQKTVFVWLKNLTHQPSSTKELLPEYKNYTNILEFMAEEQYASWAPLDRRIEAFSLAQRLHALHIKKLKQTLSEQIKHAEGDKIKQKELLKAYQQLLSK